MSETTRVSAVIPFYGAPSDTMPLVRLLQGENLREIIIVDDHSPQEFPQVDGVRVARRASNGGFGSTVNSGAALAEGDFLLVLNSDLTLEPGFVQRLMGAATRWQPAVISPAIVEDGRAAAIGKDWPTLRSAAVSWLTPLARLRDTRIWRALVGHHPTDSFDREGGRVDWVVGACMLIPTDHFRQVGGFDERYFMNSEEVDLQRRLAQIGVQSVVLPSVSAAHVGGGSSDPVRRRQWLVDGLFIYFSKWKPRAPLATALIAASVVNLAWNVTRRFRSVPIRPIGIFRDEIRLIRQGRAIRSGHGRSHS